MAANADFPQAASVQAATSVALAAIQYASYDRMVDKQDAIARRIQERADQVHEAWSGIYLPRESQIVNEIYSQATYVPQTQLRALEAQAEISRQFAIAKQNALYCLSVSCEGAVCDTERKMSVAEARAKAWQIQAAVRQEEAKADLKNAQIRSDKVQVLNIGRGHASSASTMLQAAANIYESVGEQSAGASKGLADAIGNAVGIATSPKSQSKNQQRNSTSNPIQQTSGSNTYDASSINVMAGVNIPSNPGTGVVAGSVSTELAYPGTKATPIADPSVQVRPL